MSLSIRDVNENLISLSDHLFSGAVEIGSGTYSGVIRVYNNYNQDPDIAHVRNVKLYFTPVSGARKIPIHLGDPQRDVRTNAMINNYFSGVCIYSAKLQADPSAELMNVNGGISHADYGEITASGVNNYNEYRLEMSIPSGTVLDVASGTMYAHIEYRTWLG